jgi:gluconolactonase
MRDLPPVVITNTAGFPEGPLVLPDGTLLFAEFGNHQISRWDGKTLSIFWHKHGSGPSAIAQLGEDFVIACYGSGEMIVVSADGQTKRIHVKDKDGGALIGPNDATPDGKGGVYFTTSGPWEPGPIVGRVLHLTAAGEVIPRADHLHYANGIARSADGTLLYVNESEAGRVITFRIDADGSLTDRRLFLRLQALGEPADVYPDGIKLGPDGHLYIGEYSAGRILVVTTDGQLVRRHDVPSAAAPNLAFSPDGRTLYVMAVDDKKNAPYRGTVYALPLTQA